MNDKIDVLAVMDWAAEQIIARAACASDANRFNTAQQLRDARAAIAELIEQSTECLAILDTVAVDVGLFQGDLVRMQQLRAALTAVGDA